MNAEPASSGIDRERAGRWAAEIAAGDIPSLRAVFAAAGAQGPAVIWQPKIEQLTPTQLRFLQRYWDDLRGKRPLPRAQEIDALEMRPALGYILLVDVVENGGDFRYRLFGSTVAAVSGFDLTGTLVSEHPASRHVAEFTFASYRAVLARGEPLLTEHGPPAPANTKVWQRLLLPLAGEDGSIIRFLVGNVPMTRDGQPIAQRL
jgi:hypothetical protein